MALCALALVAVALGHGSQALGQEHNATAPARNSEDYGALADRMEALERAVASQDGDSLLLSTVLSSLLAIVAGTQSAYLTVLLDKRRRRPVLAWSTYGEGRRLGKRAMPDGSITFMVRITNVGDAAAVDIKSRTTVSVQKLDEQADTADAAGTAVTADPTIDLVGSLHTKASADIPITLSRGVLLSTQGGKAVVLNIVLEYRRADNREYSCGIAVIYSGQFEALVTRWRD